MSATDVRVRIEKVQDQTRPPEAFIPSRYPYKYAADFMRGHWQELLPFDVAGLFETDDLSGSRGVAAMARRLWAESAGVEDEWLARQLADAFLKQERIPNPHLAGDEPGEEQVLLNVRDLAAAWRKFGTVVQREAAQQLEDVLAGVPVADAVNRSAVHDAAYRALGM